MKIYSPKFEPRPEQVRALEQLRGKSVFALLMAMRTGKTKVILDDFGRLELTGQISDLIVIAPGGVYHTWETAWAEHVGDDLQKRAKIYVWHSAEKDDPEIYAWLNHSGPRVLFMNVEALSRVADARRLCETVMDQRETMLVIDESTSIKNHKAKRSKFIVDKLAPLAICRRILSGLPTPRSPLDLFMQFKFLHPQILGYSDFYRFRARYAIMREQIFNGRRVPLVIGYQNQDELKAKIKPYSFRVEFRPNIPSTYTIVDIEKTAEQARIYESMRKTCTALIEGINYVTANLVIVQMLKLHQILCGFTKDEQGTIRSIPENKTKKLLEIVERGGGKVVVWCSYDYSIRRLETVLEKEYGTPAVARFWGGNVQRREIEERRFLNDENCWIMLATPHAGGKGRTWAVADSVIYFSSTNDLELRDQSEQRVQGVDKKRQVDYYDLVVPNSVEEKILGALRAKIDLASRITGAAWREWVI